MGPPRSLHVWNFQKRSKAPVIIYSVVKESLGGQVSMQLQHGIYGSASLCAGTLGIGKPAVLVGVCPRPTSPSPGRGDHRSKTVGAQKRFNDLSCFGIVPQTFINTFISMSAIGSRHSAHILPSERNAEQCPRSRAQVAKWAFSGFLSGEACAALLLFVFFEGGNILKIIKVC